MKADGHAKKIAGIRGYLTGAMQRRLILYTFALVLLLGVIFMGTIMLFGRFLYAEQRTSETLALQLSVFERDVTNHFDFIAACGIKYAEELSACLEKELEAGGISFDALNNDSDAIEGLQAALYATIRRAFELADCSGAYYLLDATANTALPNADRSKCGMYLKIANVNVTQPVDPKLVLFRGYAGATDNNRLEYHNTWALEFNLNAFPEYDTVMESADKNLNSCFLFSDARKLPGTWEKVILLGVPIVGKDGTVYGICGFEVSQLYFKLHHAQCGAVPRLTGLLARREANGLDTDLGLACGDRTGHYIDFSGAFSSMPLSGFNVYKSNDGEYVGMEMPVRLSPLEHERTIAVLMPKADYDAARADNLKENAMILALLLISAFFGCVFMSRMYVEPILNALKHAAKDRAAGSGVHYREIDELLEKLNELHASSGPLPEDLFEDFISRAKTLTPTEKAVSRHYADGKTLNEITDIMHISMNTLRTHNRHIYAKLNITTKDELVLYLELMKKSGLEDCLI